MIIISIEIHLIGLDLTFIYHLCFSSQVDAELTARRAAQPGFVGLSFATIAGADSNGAVIHYRPQPETCRCILAITALIVVSNV